MTVQLPSPSLAVRHRQSGFSILEMLLAAFILSIGILGLASLQVINLRSRTGTASITTAVLLAERVLDQANVFGRSSLLWARNGSTPPVWNPAYFGTDTITQYYKFDGSTGANGDYFTVSITPSDVEQATAGMGGIKLLRVQVNWNETGERNVIARNVVISRRIAYASS